MKKTLHIVAKVILSLILLLPVLGLTGMLGEPTRDFYKLHNGSGTHHCAYCTLD